MTRDGKRDAWVEANLPEDPQFSRGFVRHLMREAYEAGRQSARESKPKTPEVIGPYDIPD